MATGKMHNINKLLPPKILYLLECLSSAAIVNFIAVFYQKVGFSKGQIGILQGLPPLCCVIGAPLFGALSDALHAQRKVHNATIFVGCFAMYALQYITNFYIMCLAMSFASLVSCPIGSLLDQAVMAFLSKVGGEYGKQRLYGGIGYGFGAYFTGQMVSWYNIDVIFPIHVFFALASMLVLPYLPDPDATTSTLCKAQEPLNNGNSNEEKVRCLKEVEVRMSCWQQVQCKPDVALLFLVVFFMGLMFGVISSFLTLYLFNLSNGDARIVGISIFCETMSELPTFFYADKIVRTFGTSTVLLVSIVGYAMRLSYYSIMKNAWSVLPFELLHGITFSLSWAACTNHIYRAAAPGTTGAMMGLLSSIMNGVGKGMGTLVGGILYSNYGAAFMFQSTLVAVLLSLVALFFFHQSNSKRMSSESQEGNGWDATGVLSSTGVHVASPTGQDETSPLLQASPMV